VMAQPLSWSNPWQNLGTSKQYFDLAEKGYCENVIAYRAIQLVARGLASVPWLLYSMNQELEKHPLLDLLRQPNILEADNTFREKYVSHLMIGGNAYILKTLNPSGEPITLNVLRPDRITHKISESGRLVAFEYKVGQKKYTFPIDPITGACQILHLKFFNPLNEHTGMGPLQAASMAIDQHNAVAEHNFSMLQNGGRPSGAFIVKPNEYGVGLTDRQRDALSSDMKKAYEGASNAGRVLFLEGDFEWKEMGLSLKDLDFIEGKNVSAREIAQAFGVPPMLVGIPGDATFANYKEARYHLWEDTILPLMDMIVSAMNHWLCPHYSLPLRICYDADRIPALALRREASWAKIAQVDFLT
ncbi:MAG: phage portal protein, partial [Alphaproteobacteria bacterium]|nr:phage portal protein [Alphaproteobacteria bacterium]